MWTEYNPNPVGRRVGDCAVRAVAKALDTSWERAYAMLALNGFLMGDMPTSNSVIGSVLRQNHFKAQTLPDSCPDCYTAADFAADHPRGTFVLFFGNHVCTCRDGIIYDAWDSSAETPTLFWYREDDE